MKTYFSSVVNKSDASLLTSNLSQYSKRIFLIKLADFLLSSCQKKTKVFTESHQATINDRQLAGLQFLTGYIIHKIYKSIRNSKKWKSESGQYCLAVLEAARIENLNATENQKLIAALDRGGLWYPSDDTQIVKKYFLFVKGIFFLKQTIYQT